ncbi:MAG: protein BatD, partial [Bacteroidales bacterium]|nr:protein BatD [Bacteroidales bacterium]
LGYISDKLNLELSDISRDKISGLLYSRNIDNGIVEELLYLLDQCEYARYAPNPGGEGMDNNFSRAIDLISSLEL